MRLKVWTAASVSIWQNHTSDLKILLLGEVESLICNFCLNMTESYQWLKNTVAGWGWKFDLQLLSQYDSTSEQMRPYDTACCLFDKPTNKPEPEYSHLVLSSHCTASYGRCRGENEGDSWDLFCAEPEYSHLVLSSHCTASYGRYRGENDGGDWVDFEGSQPEWCISTIFHAWDTPFWSKTLDNFVLCWTWIQSPGLVLSLHCFVWPMQRWEWEWGLRGFVLCWAWVQSPGPAESVCRSVMWGGVVVLFLLTRAFTDSFWPSGDIAQPWCLHDSSKSCLPLGPSRADIYIQRTFATQLPPLSPLPHSLLSPKQVFKRPVSPWTQLVCLAGLSV